MRHHLLPLLFAALASAAGAELPAASVGVNAGGAAGRATGAGGSAAGAGSSATAAWDTGSDTWVATDGLGRELPGHDQVGGPRADRTVAMFYFLWHGPHVSGGPWNISAILQSDPGAINVGTSPPWGRLNGQHHWGESVFGYYLSDDQAVIRAHAQMLADAGVDVIVFDASNAITYRPYYETLLGVFAEIRAHGGHPPQVAFLCPFWNPAATADTLWREFYAPGEHAESWFRWQGKPLILADPVLMFENRDGLSNEQWKTAVTLAPGHTLGMSFTTDTTIGTVGGCFATWSHTDSAMTMTLHRGDAAGEVVASQRFTAVADNSWVTMHLAQPLPPGTYHLVISQPSGVIGWWSDTADVYPRGQASVDGAPVAGDRGLRLARIDAEAARKRAFFTIRKPQPDYFAGPTQPDMWSWLEVHPQHVFRNAQGEKEMMAVSVAQNAVGNRLGSMSEPGARGRSFHGGQLDRSPGAELRGANFAEQWQRALQEDPRLIFVTGWNEWTAMRLEEFSGVRAPVIFVDEFDQEHSRDIEPMRGGHGDNYYYQLVAAVRRYKGVRAAPAPCTRRTMRLDDLAAWTTVVPEYRDDIGDPVHRDHDGWNHVARYQNRTGRNDLVAAKVAWDERTVWFQVRTAAPITPATDPHWMMLFIDADADAKTGWMGYDLVVDRIPPGATTAVVERNVGGVYRWERVAEVPYRLVGDTLVLAIPRRVLGLADGAVTCDFKWADGIQETGEWSDFLLNGDVAPNGRFNYRARLGGP